MQQMPSREVAGLIPLCYDYLLTSFISKSQFSLDKKKMSEAKGKKLFVQKCKQVRHFADYKKENMCSSATPTKPVESTARVPLLLDFMASPPPRLPSTTLMPSNV
jgi:hypothetical protein